MKKTKKTLALFTPAILSSLIYSQFAHSHGWVEFPNARQNICYEDGGLWNSSIPNDACQAAYDVSGYYPFVQRNEVSANVLDYTNIDAVKAVVKDGNLCAAGDSAKAGLDVVSDAWQKTTINLDENNQFELVFYATTPHNPSYWEIYLTNESYDFSAPLTWSDLTLITTEGDIAYTSDGYVMTVTVPAGRTGDAILYTRWQRDDPAGEGFYNCSDITISGGNDSGSSANNGGNEADQDADSDDNGNDISANLTDIGYFISTDFSNIEVGDTLRFRAFTATGQEQTDVTLGVTNNNLTTWPAVLAAQFNDTTEGEWYIGIWSESMGHYMFDTTNIYANKVFAPNSHYSYQLSLIKATDDDNDNDTNSSTDTWNSSTIYNVGDTVSYSNCTWNAQWWTQGEEPGTTGEWGVWRTDDTSCDDTNGSGATDSGAADSDDGASNDNTTGNTTYVTDMIYYKGDVVTYQGCNYTAHWWTKGDIPGTTGEWGVWRTTDENCSN
ncbi:lytic polysaccharide monooxygenase [uncultured Shewanella sp.]|uniref:lytic polysaccharide monooxygenase n=1 Tax=uncultured Shewanella sp. TaxID=173975 RepID=UPI002618C700|nr:lytic polysaccharide monooxygenase [uncultured Shewanella sp.]